MPGSADPLEIPDICCADSGMTLRFLFQDDVSRHRCIPAHCELALHRQPLLRCFGTPRVIPPTASAKTHYRHREGRTLTSSEHKAIYLIKARHPGRRAAPVRDLQTYGRLTGVNAWQREPSGDPGHLLCRFRDDAKIFIPGRGFATPVHPCTLRTGAAPTAAPALFRHTASNPSHSIRQNPLLPARFFMAQRSAPTSRSEADPLEIPDICCADSDVWTPTSNEAKLSFDETT